MMSTIDTIGLEIVGNDTDVVECPAEPEEWTLEDWRAEEERQHRESLDLPGVVNITTSPPGAGKTHAGLLTAGEAGTSLTIVRTHDGAQETKRSMECLSSPIVAVPFPQLSELTCLNYAEAAAAIAAGLSASSAVCITCDYSGQCEYRRQVGEAELAAHAIATHARASHKLSEMARDKSLLVIEEDCTDLLAPTAEVQDGLELVEAVARDGKLASDPQQAAYFSSLEATTQWLNRRLSDAYATVTLEMPEAVERPDGIDNALFRLIRARARVGSTPPSAEALRICRAVTEGTLASLSIRVDTTPGPGRREVVTKSVFATRRAALPRHAAVWLHDATADPAEIAALTGMPVVDRTPRGKLKGHWPVVQVPFDVTKGMTDRTFVAALRGLLAAFPQYQRVGLITHLNHLAAAIGSGRKYALEPELRQRIAKAAHFFGTQTRGSNSWLETCDAIFVVGTPRPKQSVVKSRMLRRPDFQEAANRDGGWGPIEWTGNDTTGDERTVKGLGYRDPAWAEAHRLIVHAELRQAVGRGRSILETGMPVVVVTTENLGLALVDVEVKPFLESEAEVATTMRKLSEQFATEKVKAPEGQVSGTNHYNIIVGACSVSSADIAHAIGKGDRYVRNVLSKLESSGYVERIGQRSGWKLTPKGFAAVGIVPALSCETHNPETEGNHQP